MSKELHPIKPPKFQIEGANIVYIREGRIGEGERHGHLYYYSMRHPDWDWSEPCNLELSVVVNFFGTLATLEPVVSLESFLGRSDLPQAYIELTQEQIDLIIEHRDYE